MENDSFATGLQSASVEVGIVFSSEEVRIIRAHYDFNGGNDHKGKGKSKHKGLPPVRDGYERIVVAGKILLIEIASQMVVDILSDALFE